jgi:hypothetical protein
MAPGIPGIPNDVQGPAPDAPFRRSPRCSDTSDAHGLHPPRSGPPWSIGSAQAASTACSPSVSTAVRISTICRSNAAAPGVAGGSVANPNQARSEILRLWTADFAKGQDLDPGDKAYVAQVAAARTGLSQVASDCLLQLAFKFDAVQADLHSVGTLVALAANMAGNADESRVIQYLNLASWRFLEHVKYHRLILIY